jgi:hypothetical protein
MTTAFELGCQCALEKIGSGLSFVGPSLWNRFIKPVISPGTVAMEKQLEKNKIRGMTEYQNWRDEVSPLPMIYGSATARQGDKSLGHWTDVSPRSYDPLAHTNANQISNKALDLDTLARADPNNSKVHLMLAAVTMNTITLENQSCPHLIKARSVMATRLLRG